MANVCIRVRLIIYTSISYHRKILPTQILKMLATVESLIFSRLSYALSVWVSALHQDSLRIELQGFTDNKLFGSTCGMTKSDHISHPRQAVGWLSPTMLVQHCSMCAMLDQYISKEFH